MDDKQVRFLSKNLLVAEKLKTIVCLHMKVAWTSIKTILLNNTLPEEEVPHMKDNDISWMNLRTKHNITQLNDPRFTIEDQRYRLKHYYKFYFVRHPLDRIFSGYHDKLVVEMDDGHGIYYKILLQTIIDAVRPDLQSKRMEDIRLPFEDVLRLIEAGKMDQHFIGPYFRKCQPCKIKYDYIGKVETFDHDMANIIERQFPAKRGKNTRLNVAGTHEHTQRFCKRLKAYEDVPKKLFNNTVNYYASDFVNYGYIWHWTNGSFVVQCNGTCC